MGKWSVERINEIDFPQSLPVSASRQTSRSHMPATYSRSPVISRRGTDPTAVGGRKEGYLHRPFPLRPPELLTGGSVQRPNHLEFLVHRFGNEDAVLSRRWARNSWGRAALARSRSAGLPSAWRARVARLLGRLAASPATESRSRAELRRPTAATRRVLPTERTPTKTFPSKTKTCQRFESLTGFAVPWQKFPERNCWSGWGCFHFERNRIEADAADMGS